MGSEGGVRAAWMLGFRRRRVELPSLGAGGEGLSTAWEFLPTNEPGQGFRGGGRRHWDPGFSGRMIAQSWFERGSGGFSGESFPGLRVGAGIPVCPVGPVFELVYDVAQIGESASGRTRSRRLEGFSHRVFKPKRENEMKSKSRDGQVRRLVGLGMVGAFLFGMAGCGGSGEDRGFVSIGTAPVGGVFYLFGAAVSSLLNEESAEGALRVTAESTGGSMENIRRIDSGDLQLAISNSSISYFAARGEAGWEKAYPIRAVMTLFPNVAFFVTKKESGIEKLADLKGKRVAVGPEGAGFEFFIRPLLEAHGVTYDDFEDVYAGQQQCVDQMGDGAIDAAFLGGAQPTPSIVSASVSMDLHFIPFGEAEKKTLLDTYPFFAPATVKAETYKDQSQPFNGLNVGSAHLIVGADADEEFVYKVTKTIYENREKLIEKHGAARALKEHTVIRNTGVEFHPGAVRFYKEIGIWK